MIEEAYCSYEVSKLLKEKGFNELCFRLVRSDGDVVEAPSQAWNGMTKKQKIEFCLCPTHQMAMAYLREKGIHISPKYCCFQGPKKNDKPYYKWEDRVLKLSSGEQIHPDVLGIHEYYSSYEDAVEAALKFCIKNLI